MSKTIKWIVVILVLFLVIVGVWYYSSKPTTPTETGPIKIGAILPLTGFGSNIGENEQRGLLMALDDLKLQKYNVILSIEDSAGQASQAVSAINKLISVEEVEALFVSLSTPAEAVSPIALENNKVMIYDAFDPKITEKNNLAFKAFFDVQAECQKFVKYAKDNNVKKVAYIGPKLSFVDYCVNILNSELGQNNVIAEFTASPNDSDFRTQLLKAKTFGAQFIVSIAYEGNYLSIMKQKEELDFKVPIFCTLSDCYSEKIKAMASPTSLEGLVAYGFHLDDDFVKRVKEKYPEATTADLQLIAIGYDSLSYLVKAIASCSKNDTACVAAKIKDSNTYRSKVKSDGYGDDQLFKPLPDYYKIKNGLPRIIEI